MRILPVSGTIWLPFDETAGTTARDALGRPLGTLNGFATPDWVAGRWGGGLRFFADGNSDTVVLAGIKGVTGTAARTVAFWLNADQGDARSRGGELACFPTEHRWNRAIETLGGSELDPYQGL
jgi:hypothetical protein